MKSLRRAKSGLLNILLIPLSFLSGYQMQDSAQAQSTENPLDYHPFQPVTLEYMKEKGPLGLETIMPCEESNEDIQGLIKSIGDRELYYAESEAQGPSAFDLYLNNQMFGRVNCKDNDPGNLTDPGFPAEPTRVSTYPPQDEFLQFNSDDSFIYTKEMHNRTVTVAFKKDFTDEYHTHLQVNKEWRDFMANFIFDTWAIYWKEYGGFVYDSYTVLFGNNLPWDVGGFGNGFEASTVWTNTVSHEMYHAWNGNAFRQEGERMWFLEGATIYYNCRHDAGSKEGAPIVSMYDIYFQNYYKTGKDEAIGNLSMNDPDYDLAVHNFVGYKGSVIAFLLDKELEKTGHHLGQVARVLFRRYGIYDTDPSPSNQDILSVFNEVSGEDFTDFFERYIYGSEMLPVPNNFSRLCHDCTNPMPEIGVNEQKDPVVLMMGESAKLNVKMDPFSHEGLKADWWVAEHDDTGWSSYVYAKGWGKGLSPCVQTPLFNLNKFNVPGVDFSEGKNTFYFAVDNNSDGKPDANWWDSINVYAIKRIFPQGMKEIPAGNIKIDGLAYDWEAIGPYVSDAAGDSSGGEGTDLKALYLATDGINLFWRLDTWSGTYAFSDHKMFEIKFSIPGKDDLFSVVTWDGEGGMVKTRNIEPFVFYYQAGGNEYGRSGEITEGKIPLLFFGGESIDSININAKVHTLYVSHGQGYSIPYDTIPVYD